MNKSIFLLGLLTTFTFWSCETQQAEDLSQLEMIEAEQVQNFSCLNAQLKTAKSVSETQNLIPGTWQLKAIMSMLPSTEIPNYVLVIDNDYNVIVKKAGKSVVADKLIFFEKNEYGSSVIGLKNTKQYFDNQDFSFLYGTIRICENELLIDNGMAFDAPGYYFRKVGSN